MRSGFFVPKATTLFTMRNVLLAAILLLSVAAKAQTLKIEFDSIESAFKQGKVLQVDAIKKRALLEKIYPVLPYDTLIQDFSFSWVIDLPGVPKNVIFKRVKERCAALYGDIDAVLRYEDMETGKIIVKGYVPIHYKQSYQGLWKTREILSQADCYHTLVFTIKEGKMKYEMLNLTYRGSIAYSATNSTYQYDFKSMFPVGMKSEIEIRNTLEVASDTFRAFDLIRKHFQTYILAWKSDYEF